MNERAVRVEDGVVGVLPALMEQAIGGLLVILYEAIAVSVSVPVDPEEGGFDVGPEGFHERPVAGPFIVRASQQDKQWRSIHAAVVAAEGHLFQHGHLAVAGLV
jgi:hypothetical protein